MITYFVHGAATDRHNTTIYSFDTTITTTLPLTDLEELREKLLLKAKEAMKDAVNIKLYCVSKL